VHSICVGVGHILCSAQYKPQILLLVQIPHVTHVDEVPKNLQGKGGYTNKDIWPFLLHLASFVFLQLEYLFIQLNVWKILHKEEDKISWSWHLLADWSIDPVQFRNTVRVTVVLAPLTQVPP
jgi:hypothetical protein